MKMTVENKDFKIQSQIRENELKKKKRNYIPGLAAFYFRPTHPWTLKQTEKMYRDTYSDDNDKIFYEDCIQGMKKIPDESIDLVIADPPFGLEFSGKESIYNRDSDFVLEGYKEIEKSEYYEFLRLWISELPRLMKQTSSALIFSGWTNLLDVLAAINNTDLHVMNHIIWQYQFGVYTQKKFVSSHYHILWLVKNPKKYFFNKIEHYPIDVWKISRKYKRGEKKNGTKLPKKVVSNCMHFLSKPGDLILDPFMGNGTTAVCAKGNYRYFVGFEINKYMKNIIDRNLSRVEVGQLFSPYSEIKPDIKSLKQKYLKAYKIYLKNKGLETDDIKRGGRSNS